MGRRVGIAARSVLLVNLSVAPLSPVEREAADNWFLTRGLPAVLPRRARWRRLWVRSAPVLAAAATAMVCVAVLAFLAGDDGTVVFDDDPAAAEWFALLGLVLILPVAVLAGWLTARAPAARHRRAVATVSVAVMVVTLALEGSVADRLCGAVQVAAFVLAVLALNGFGVGSILAWAVRLTFEHLASVGALAARALPVVLLTVLVFFNTYVWSMAATISGERLWLAMGFLFLIAVAFLFTGIADRVGPILGRDTDGTEGTPETPLHDTPFADLPDPQSADPLSRDERLNIMFVVLASQIAQVAMVALVTSAIFFTLGLIVLSPDLLARWSPESVDHVVLFGVTVPVAPPLINVAMFQGALTFMYVSARAVGDGEYRADFLDPLVDDLRVTLAARSRYRHALGSH